MPAANLGSLVYGVELDPSQLPAGVTASTREFNKVKKIFRETETEAERLNREQEELNALYKKGVLPLEAYRRAMDKLENSTDELADSQKELSDGIDVESGGFGKLSGIASAVAGGFAAAAASAAAVVGSVVVLTEHLAEMQQRLAVESRLGIDSELLAGIQLSAGKAGVEIDAVNDSLKEFVVKAQEASREGSGDAFEGFKILGFVGDDLERLARLDAGEAFLEIADAVSKLNTQNERLLVLDQLASDAGVELVEVLKQGSDGLREQTEAAKELGLVLGTEQRDKINESAEAYQTFQAATQGFWDQLTVASAPVLTEIYDGLTDIISQVNMFLQTNPEEFQEAIKSVAEDVRFLFDGLSNLTDLALRFMDSPFIRYLNAARGGGIGLVNQAFADLTGVNPGRELINGVAARLPRQGFSNDRDMRELIAINRQMLQEQRQSPRVGVISRF